MLKLLLATKTNIQLKRSQQVDTLKFFICLLQPPSMYKFVNMYNFIL